MRETKHRNHLRLTPPRSNRCQATDCLTLELCSALDVPHVMNSRITLKIYIQSASGDVFRRKLLANQSIEFKFSKVVGKIKAAAGR